MTHSLAPHPKPQTCRFTQPLTRHSIDRAASETPQGRPRCTHVFYPPLQPLPSPPIHTPAYPHHPYPPPHLCGRVPQIHTAHVAHSSVFSLHPQQRQRPPPIDHVLTMHVAPLRASSGASTPAGSTPLSRLPPSRSPRSDGSAASAASGGGPESALRERSSSARAGSEASSAGIVPCRILVTYWSRPGHIFVTS